MFSYLDPQLNLKNFTFIRADNLHHCKRGGGSICLEKTLGCSPRKSKQNVIYLDRSLSQSKDDLDNFLLNFEQRMSDRMSQNPLFMLVTG